ncbi:lamin tail domain-containing protein 2-like isoform X2 [Pseudophryne corroboree]|uniref:lamin tail domain-containing protein 2-like isoform X2 n=1 Tax=Pseudophryne corroboree TaxID=495146 RepID=UPI003081AEF8
MRHFLLFSCDRSLFLNRLDYGPCCYGNINRVVHLTAAMNKGQKNGFPYYSRQVTGNTWGRETEGRRKTQQAKQEGFLCPLKIVEVNSLGYFIRILNTSQQQTVDIGGYILRQLEAGHVVSMYRFPQNLLVPPLQHITIWTSAAKISHHPPTDLVWKGRAYFRTDPQCITVLSRPNNQPVASYKPDGSPCLYTTARLSISQNQTVIRRPMMEQNLSKSNSAPPAPPRTCDVPAMPHPDSRITHSIFYPAGIRQKFPLTSRNSGLACTDSPPSVTWNPRRLNTNSPLVRLVVQKTARSKHGFNYLSHIPFTYGLLGV